MRYSRLNKEITLLMFLLFVVSVKAQNYSEQWVINSNEDWRLNKDHQSNLDFEDGMAIPNKKSAKYKSKLKKFAEKTAAKSILVEQSTVWENWKPTSNIGPANLGDAPVFVKQEDGNYWMFGRYGSNKNTESFVGKDITIEGYSIPLKTTPYENQYDAPGGLKPNLGGYHAWQSKDMKTWIHHGSVSENFSRWMTTGEYVDGKFYLYYDFPNDQDPHLYIDENLEDGVPGENIGMAFEDPSDGSDCAIIRDLEGNFHLILEDWSPIDASTHAWDSPLAMHAVSSNGKSDFKILAPPVDERTKPTGEFSKYAHPHWHAEAPERFSAEVATEDIPKHRIKKGDKRAFGKYEIHEPEQNAYGDWASISIGGQYYLFGDYDPKDGHGAKDMSVAWFTSSDINKPFTFCSNIGKGHPDPDIMFAEGKFYLATQLNTDFVSDGPWVEHVEARIGVDTNNDGAINYWSSWKTVKESYATVEGFSKQVSRKPATLDLSDLPEGYGFQFEINITDTTENKSKPIIDNVVFTFHQ